MGRSHNRDDHTEQRLRRIEAQLHDILLWLDTQSQEEREQIALREVFRELEAEKEELALELFNADAANDSDWGVLLREEQHIRG